MATFKRLIELGPEIVSDVDNMLLSGESAIRVAKWLRDEKGVLNDLKEASVKKNLERYRAKDLKEKLYDDIASTNKGVSTVGLKKKLIAIDALEDAALIQFDRMNKAVSLERKAQGFVLKQANEEMRLYKELLVELGKMQFETGVMRRVPKTTTGQISDPLTGDTKEFTWTEEQSSLYEQLRRAPVIEGRVISNEEASGES